MTKNNNSEFFTTLVCWCFQWGCEFRLVNKIYSTPGKEILIPEVVFSKDERHISFRADSLDELFIIIEYSHKKIFTELSIPYFSSNKQSKKMKA